MALFLKLKSRHRAKLFDVHILMDSPNDSPKMRTIGSIHYYGTTLKIHYKSLVLSSLILKLFSSSDSKLAKKSQGIAYSRKFEKNGNKRISLLGEPSDITWFFCTTLTFFFYGRALMVQSTLMILKRVEKHQLEL